MILDYIFLLILNELCNYKFKFIKEKNKLFKLWLLYLNDFKRHRFQIK